MPLIFSIQPNVLGQTWTVPQYKMRSQLNESEANSKLEFCRLGDIANIASGQYVRSYSDRGVPYLRVNNIRKVILNVSSCDIVYIPYKELSETVTDRCICKTGDVLISRTGTLGKAALVSGQFDGCMISQHLTRLTIFNRGIISPERLCLFFNSPLGSSQLISKGMGSSRLELTHEALADIKVPALDSESRAVFDRRLKGLIDNYYEQINKLSSLVNDVERVIGMTRSQKTERSSTFEDFPVNRNNDGCDSHSFSLSLHELDELWLPKRYLPEIMNMLGKVEQDFRCVNLEDITSVNRGKGTTVSEYCNAGMPFLRTSSLINHSIDPFPDHYANQYTFERFGQPIEDGDIIFSIEGKIGQVAMLFSDLPVTIKNHIELVRTKEARHNYCREELSGWIFLILSSKFGKIQAFRNSVVQSTIPGLAHRLRKFRIPFDDKTRSAVKSLGRQAYTVSREVMCAIAGLQTIQNDFSAYVRQQISYA